jgi:hypothetical protein
MCLMMLCDYVLDYVIDDAMVLWFDGMSFG